MERAADPTSLGYATMANMGGLGLAEYNGQRTIGSLPEQASKLFYEDAVYHLFYAFLFSPDLHARES